MSGVYAHSFVDVSQSRICFPYLFKELCFIYIGAYKLLRALLSPCSFSIIWSMESALSYAWLYRNNLYLMWFISFRFIVSFVFSYCWDSFSIFSAECRMNGWVRCWTEFANRYRRLLLPTFQVWFCLSKWACCLFVYLHRIVQLFAAISHFLVQNRR